MEIPPLVPEAYLERAFDQMVAVLDRVTDEEIPVRPFGPTTNSVSGLVMHCAGVCEWWLGHVGLGEPTDRDRAAELRSEAGRDELLARIATVRAAAPRHLARLAAGEGTPHEARATLYGDGSDDSVVLHVLEELYQHLGHLDVTADALVSRRGG